MNNTKRRTYTRDNPRVRELKRLTYTQRTEAATLRAQLDDAILSRVVAEGERASAIEQAKSAQRTVNAIPAWVLYVVGAAKKIQP